VSRAGLGVERRRVGQRGSAPRVESPAHPTFASWWAPALRLRRAALWLLAHLDERDPLPRAQLAEQLGVDPTALGEPIEQLHQRVLVRSEDGGPLALTATGRES
jgi:hypothetical protein